MPRSGYLVAAKIVAFIFTALLVILVLQNRHTVAHWIRGRQVEGARHIVPSVMRSRLAEIWHIPVVVYLVGVYLVWAFDIAGAPPAPQARGPSCQLEPEPEAATAAP